MLLKKISFLALIIIASLTACKKDSTSTDNAVLLTTGKWKLTAETTGTIDTYKNYGACEKDDTWTFGADGKLQTAEAPAKAVIDVTPPALPEIATPARCPACQP